jgi:hypothetical protein
LCGGKDALGITLTPVHVHCGHGPASFRSD